MLHGIDIASHQKGISVADIDADFVIIKVSGGTSYTNGYPNENEDYWRKWADETLAAGKLLGFYHYACEYGSEPGGRAEAEFFWDHVKDYAGKFIPILDWENHALSMPVSYAKDFLDRIAELSGATPWFYAYASNVNSTDYSAISNYPLWMASYLYRYESAGFVDDPDNNWDTGDWDKMIAYQYSSTGDIEGYDGDIDLSVFYGSREDWERMCGMADEPVNNVGMRYRAHVQNIGWQDWKRDGQSAGTTGQALRLEALQIDPPQGWNLTVRLHIQNEGWKTYENIVPGNSVTIGTTGLAERIEAIKIDVVEKPAGAGKLQFMVHQENQGWKGWTDEGYASGTDGMSLRLEAIKIEVV